MTRAMLPAYGLRLLWTALAVAFALFVWSPGEDAATTAFVAILGGVGNGAILILWTRKGLEWSGL